MIGVDELKFDAQGLIPAVVQEAATGEVLMVAWMGREALEATQRTGLTHFWSRSRQALWRKGESSGHAQHVEALYADCDRDTLLVLVHQEGVACHTGSRTCFFSRLKMEGEPPAEGTDGRTWAGPQILELVERVIQSRKVEPPSGSYVAGLLAKGESAVCRKVGEEALEVIMAALAGERDDRLVSEVADLWFHTMVLLGGRGIPLRRVFSELARRHAGTRVDRSADLEESAG
ncbi:MAG: bifunctional phosphoribosyl-AMP cyclohydrolase/phosphoribosyl-ATP diphosphatase HisIE [Candidatus Rokubacteria bacterium]|nr:bifunctional phosphoribosyl-AMP cyclohydrolase/phosphoribosyl-ATP diphosphatase HisIE [Candidatus Rokubacteria bacterium]